MPILAHLTDSISTIAPDSLVTLGAMSPVVINLLVGLFLFISIAMILLVLIQRPQGGGLSGAFGSGGGGGAGQTAFGTKTGDVLTYATIGIFVCFLLFAVVLNFATRPTEPGQSETLITAPAETTPPIDSGNDSTDASAESAEEESGETTDEGTIDLSGDPEATIEDLPAQDTPPLVPTEEPTDVPSGEPASEDPAGLPAGDD